MSLYLVVCSVALLASALTFYSGFGLGTLLLPVFALFVPVEQAVALTAVVHFLNGLFKLVLVGRHAVASVVLRFGVPAIVAALLGAWLLARISGAPPLFSWSAFGRAFEVTPVRLAIGVLLLGFALLELWPRFRALAIPPRWMPVGGALSGFFGGLSGLQGALRSAFLVRAGLGREGFIATGVVVSVLVDLARLGIYAGALERGAVRLDPSLLAAAVLAAFAGAALGNRFLHKVTLPALQTLVAVLLAIFALALAAGVL